MSVSVNCFKPREVFLTPSDVDKYLLLVVHLGLGQHIKMVPVGNRVKLHEAGELP